MQLANDAVYYSWFACNISRESAESNMTKRFVVVQKAFDAASKSSRK